MAVAENSILRITGDEQDFQLWASLAAGVRHLPAVHAVGHADVGDEEVDAQVGLQNLQPRDTVCIFDGGVAEVLKNLRHQHAHGWLVAYDEHGLALSGTRLVTRVASKFADQGLMAGMAKPSDKRQRQMARANQRF